MKKAWIPLVASLVVLAGCQTQQPAPVKQKAIEEVIAEELAMPEDNFKQERDASITKAENTRGGSGIRESAYIHTLHNDHYLASGVGQADMSSYLPPQENVKARERQQKANALRAKSSTRDKSVYSKDRSVYSKDKSVYARDKSIYRR